MGRDLVERLGGGLAQAEDQLHGVAYENLRKLVERHEHTFRDHGSRIDFDVARRLSETRALGLHRYSVGRYGAQVVEACQRELVQGYLQGLTTAQLADRIAGVDGAIARHRGRGALIVRMELSRIYDAGHQAALEEVATLDSPGTSDPLLKQATEYLDERNHPFSRKLHRVAVYPRQQWEIPVVGAEGRGLVWRVTNGIAHGTNYPAHYHDRGRQVPWRPSWGGGTWQRRSELAEIDLTARDRSALRRQAQGRRRGPMSGAGLAHAERAGLVDRRGDITPTGSLVLHPERLAPTGRPGDPVLGKQDRDRRPRSALSVRDEQAAARALSADGYRLRWVPKSKANPPVRTPDLEVEAPDGSWRRLDVTRNVRGNPLTLIDRVRDKVESGQADYIVVACESAHVDNLRDRIRLSPHPRLKQLWFLVDGRLVPGYG